MVHDDLTDDDIVSGDARRPVFSTTFFLEGGAVLLVLFLAAYLRLAYAAANPGWYSDEGTLVNIAQNMMRGRIQDYALTRSTLLTARLPLFAYFASLWFRVVEPGIPGLRVLSGWLGIITCGLLYLVVRSCLGRSGAGLAVVAALILAVYPSAVVYARMGFSYNLIAPLVLVLLWGAWRYLTLGDRGALAIAAIAVGLGCVTDIVMLVFLVLLGILISLRRMRDLPWAMGLAILPPAIYVVTMLISDAPAFLFDARFTANRLAAVPLWAQPGLLSVNLASLVGNDFWIGLGIIGVFVLRPMRWRWFVILALFFPIIAVGRSTGLTGLRTYYLIPLFPLVAVGIAALLVAGIPVIQRTLHEAISRAFERWSWPASSTMVGWARRRLIVLGTALGVFGIGIIPVMVPVVQTFVEVRSGLHTPSDPVTIDPEDALTVAAFVNQRAAPGDLVVASPAFGWLLKADVAEFEQVAAAQGGVTVDFPSDVPADRFAYDINVQRAKYVVVDRVWDNWAVVYMPAVRKIRDEIATWPVALQRGEFRVYENPSY
jgi:hypothetical protein